MALALAVGAAGCKFDRYDHHYAQPAPRPNPTCTGIRPRREVTMPGNPGVTLPGEWYGGTSSWTYEGDPPAGDVCAWPPPSVKRRLEQQASR